MMSGKSTIASRAAYTSAVFLITLFSCDKGPSDPVPQDATVPHVEVVFPTGTAYDEDGDALVDIRVKWSDSSGIDLSSVRVEALSSETLSAVNLLTTWRVTQLDSAGLAIHERKEAMLPHGQNAVLIIAKDRFGNVRQDTVRVALPYSAQTKTIVSGLTGNGQMVKGTYCKDENRILMTAGSQILVIDPDSLRVSAQFTGAPFNQTSDVLCLPGDGVLYVTAERVHSFDRRSFAQLPDVAGTFASRAISRSSSNPDRLYVGEDYVATASILSRSLNRRTGDVGIPYSTWPSDIVASIVVMPRDEKLYLTRADEGGILVVDPASKSVVRRISLAGESSNAAEFGRSDDLELNADSSILYAAVLDGSPRGVARIDTRTDKLMNLLSLDGRSEEIELSPDGHRLFVTTHDLTSAPSHNFLVDVVTWKVLQTLDRPRASGAVRFDGPIVFHPSGRWFFVGHNLDISVYLNRE